MRALKKMVHSIRATCQTDDGTVILSDAIFSQIDDQESMPCKYYAQFQNAAGERKAEVAEKLAKLFDLFTEEDLEMMNQTDDELETALDFKTAIFINVSNPAEEYKAKLLITLLNYFIQRVEEHPKTFFVLDAIKPNYMIISLPHWIKKSDKYNMSFLVCSNELASFQETKEAERFFKNLKKNTTAFIFTHADNNYEDEQIATILIPEEELNEQDELF